MTGKEVLTSFESKKRAIKTFQAALILKSNDKALSTSFESKNDKEVSSGLEV